VLHCIQVSWQQHAQTENALQIAETAAELYSRICTLSNILKPSAAAWNGRLGPTTKLWAVISSGSDQRASISSALGIESAGKQLPEIAPVEVNVRRIAGNGGVPKGDLFDR
jgi:DNA anti-recombination protein RmuC